MPSEKVHRATWLPVQMNPPGNLRDLLKRYGLALFLAGLALLIRRGLPVPLGTAIYQLPLAAVVLTCWFGGRGPGLLASLTCATGLLYWFIPPVNTFAISPGYRLPFAIFIGLCLLLSEFGAGRRRAVQALRAGEERYRTFLDVAADALMVHTQDGTVIDVNRQACENLGYTSQELIGMKPAAFDAGIDETGLRRVIEQVAAGDPVTFETQWRRKDGTVFPVEVRGRQFRHGARWLGISISRDISERKRADAELRASEGRFRTFVDHATDSFLLLDKQLRVVDVNRQACESMGWSREELIGMHPSEFDAGLDEPSIRRLTQRADAGEIITFETRHRRKDGTAFPVEIRTGTFSQGGEPFYLALARDISERKQAEERTAKLAAIVESSDDAIIGKDLNGIITTWNAGAERIFGYAAQEIIGQSVTTLLPPDRPDEERGILERVRRGERMDHFETVRRRKDGTLVDVSLTVSPIIEGNGNVVGASKVARDISERKRAESRFAGKGLCAGDGPDRACSRVAGDGAGRADHFDCPRGRPAPGRDDRQRRRLHALARRRAARHRGSALGARQHHRRRQARARGHRANPRANEARDAAQGDAWISTMRHWRSSRSRSGSCAAMTSFFGRSSTRTLPRVAGDRVQLQQVLINLIMNAIEAMSGVRDRPRELTIVSGQDGPKAVRVEVRDSGTGLDPKGAERVFEAFYTTKAEGIGIGLSISRSIVEAHGGRLWASPNEPHGAVFRFSLPVAEEAPS